MRPEKEVVISTQTESVKYDIQPGTSLYAVVYDNQFFSLRTERISLNAYRRYERTCFINYASAKNLADKLNQYFATQDFTVREIR